ncbi:MAG: DUF1003 domain-containing protein [Flavobacterium sp.]|nr:DUF1003 domain-containing protein [Flavobacterium sp.]
MKNKQSFTSDISGLEFDIKNKVSANSIRLPLLNLIQKDYPDFDASKTLSESELLIYREKYIGNFLTDEAGELTDLHKNIVHSITDDKSIVSKLQDDEVDDDRTFGQIVADNVAAFGGSWKFIILFFIFILLWIAANAFFLINKGFDPYPFILLNLILSCLAALQAPVIMMSQNRQEEKDRVRAKKDYMINLKSELEIRLLDEKIDHLIMHQQQELIEMQKLQIEMMNDILQKVK